MVVLLVQLTGLSLAAWSAAWQTAVRWLKIPTVESVYRHVVV